MLITRSIAFLAAFLCAAPAPAQPAKPATQPAAPAATARKVLRPGDPAPAFKVANWIKGEEIKTLDKGKVYLIDFWATYAGTCKITIPHLTEIAKKHKDSLTVVGVAIWEETKGKDGPIDPVPGIETFIKDLGEGAGYRIAYGGPQGEMEVTWMRAAERPGVPTTFLIDKEGRIAWIGPPLQVNEPLAKLLAGNLDPEAQRAEAKKQEERLKKLKELQDHAINASQGGRAKELLDVAREAVAVDPKPFQSIPGECFRRVLVNMKEPDLAYAYAKEFLEGPGTRHGMALDLNTMAWVTLDDPGVKNRDLDLAMRLAQKAAELSEFKDPAIVDTLARAYWEKGDAAKALELAEQAAALAEKVPDLPPQVKNDITRALERYRKGK